MGCKISLRKQSKVGSQSDEKQENLGSPACAKTKVKDESLNITDAISISTSPSKPVQTITSKSSTGDGVHVVCHPDRQPELFLTRRANNENKKRTGTTLATKPRSSKSPGMEACGTVNDYPPLPGQVSPDFPQPGSGDIGGIGRQAFSQDSYYFTPTKLGSLVTEENVTEPKTFFFSTTAQKNGNDDHGDGDEDKTEMMKEGTLLAELHNRDMYGTSVEEELQNIEEMGDVSNPRPSYSTLSSSFMEKEFQLTLEQIFQSELPMSDPEVMEVEAVTGTAQPWNPLPPGLSQGFQDAWKAHMVRNVGDAGTGESSKKPNTEDTSSPTGSNNAPDN